MSLSLSMGRPRSVVQCPRFDASIYRCNGRDSPLSTDTLLDTIARGTASLTDEYGLGDKAIAAHQAKTPWAQSGKTLSTQISASADFFERVDQNRFEWFHSLQGN